MLTLLHLFIRSRVLDAARHALVLASIFPLGLIGGSLHAAARTWTGAGGSDLWNDPANWQGGLIPVSGDDVQFGGNPTHLENTVNFSLALNLFKFAKNSQLFFVHVPAGVLSFTGEGILNQTSGGGPIRQEFAETGGAILLSAESRGTFR